VLIIDLKCWSGLNFLFPYDKSKMAAVIEGLIKVYLKMIPADQFGYGYLAHSP
jgi:hypothetical protein